MINISLYPCDRCGQPTDCRYIMTNQSGTWRERVDGSPALPGDLHCCYDCTEQLEQPVPVPVDDLDDDYDIDNDWPTEFTIYLLLRNERVVYVGKGRAPEYRLQCHSKKRFWVFNDVIETADGPYSEAEALRREKALIGCYQPIYNVQHRTGKRTPIEPTHAYYLMFQAVEAARLEARRQ